MTVDASGRLQRILRVMPLIVGRGDVPVAEVESVSGVDARTLLDDLRALTERDDEPGGFVEAVSILFEAETVAVSSRHFARPARITLPELCALELGLAMLGASAVGAEHDTVVRARKRVREAIVAMPNSAATEDLWYASGPAIADENLLISLRASATGRRKARIAYRKGASAESSERVVHPYAVLPVRGAWFVVAHCEVSDGLRFFRADRVLSVTPLDDVFERPPSVDLDSLVAVGGPMVSPAAERLVVRYSPRIARWIAEREEGESAADGSFTVSHPLNDDAWAVRHVLQYGPDAEVLEPARVRDLVAEVLRGMIRAGNSSQRAASSTAE